PRRGIEREVNIMPHEINKLAAVRGQVILGFLPTTRGKVLDRVEGDRLRGCIGDDRDFTQMDEVIFVLVEIVVLPEAERGPVPARQINGRADQIRFDETSRLILKVAAPDTSARMS